MSFRVLNYKYMVHIKFMEGFLEYNNILLGMSKQSYHRAVGNTQYGIRKQHEIFLNFFKKFHLSGRQAFFGVTA